jgi:hypothetical protein
MLLRFNPVFSIPTFLLFFLTQNLLPAYSFFGVDFDLIKQNTGGVGGGNNNGNRRRESDNNGGGNNNGADGSTGGVAGGRGCSRPETYANLPDLTFLSPDSSSTGTTTRDFPTFLVYTPFDLTNESPGHFVLETLNGDEIYSDTIWDQPGNSILAVPIPSSISRLLEVGETYQVNFYVFCGDLTMSNSTSLVTDTEVKRAAPNILGTHWYDNIFNAYQQGVTSLQFRSLLETQNNLRDIPEALGE